MKIIKILRKPYLAIFFSGIILLSSCSQYDTINSDEQNFNYSLFNEYKSGNTNVDLSSILMTSDNNVNKFKATINKVNLELNTDITIPNKAYELINYDAEKIYSVSLENGWLTQEDIDLSKKLTTDIISFGIDTAISNYEKEVLNMSLSNEEFGKKNAFLNVIKSVNYNNPRLFNNDFSADNTLSYKIVCSWCKCAAASVALYTATMSLAACITIIACGLAIVLVYAASNSFAAMCLE